MHLKLMVLRICKVYYKYKFYNFILLKLMENLLIIIAFLLIFFFFLSIAILAKALGLYERRITLAYTYIALPIFLYVTNSR